MKSSSPERVEPLAAKVPEITLMFWVIKVLTTGMGESMSDFLGQKSIPIGGAIGVFGFATRCDFNCGSASTARRSTGSRS
jgi:uncharacterized membrane-anchored protein